MFPMKSLPRKFKQENRDSERKKRSSRGKQAFFMRIAGVFP